MKKRCTAAQVIQILRKADTTGTNFDVDRTYGLCKRPFDRWRPRCQGLSFS